MKVAEAAEALTEDHAGGGGIRPMAIGHFRHISVSQPAENSGEEAAIQGDAAPR